MKKNKSTLFFSGMQVRFKHEDEGDAYAGRMWYFQKLLPNNKAELITLEGDVQCITDIKNIEPDCTMKNYALRLISQGKSFRIDLKARNFQKSKKVGIRSAYPSPLKIKTLQKENILYFKALELLNQR